MPEVQIITPPGMFGGSANDDWLDMALRIIGVGFGEEGGWNAKYGADFENDVFLMKRFCWCERDDCPWCTGCGAFQDTCKACAVSQKHAADCYLEKIRDGRLRTMEAEMEAALAARNSLQWGSRAGSAAQKEVDRISKLQRAHEDRVARALCKEHGIAWNGGRGSYVHCACGAEVRGKQMRAAGLGCDYDQGGGMFARFAPCSHDPTRRYYDPPNFWFKPDDFRVTWYKYIGRDMATNKDGVSGDFLHRIFAAHPRGMTLEDAIAETAAREEQTAAGFAKMFSDLGIETR